MTIAVQTPVEAQIYFNFQLLPELRKKIFQYIQFLLQKYNRAFPSMQHIAEVCGCSLITVKRAIKFFSEVGWITKMKRCYRSSVYAMDASILKLDLSKNRTFRNRTFSSANDTVGDTIYNVAKSDKINQRKGKVPVEVAVAPPTEIDVAKKMADNRKAFNQRVKYYAPSRKVEIDDDSLESLIKNFVRGKPESILINALEGLESAKKPIANPVGWLFTMCSYWKRKAFS